MGGNAGTTGSFGIFIPMILFFVILWFFMVRPQRKKDKETKQMRDNLVPGDRIVTIGGIVGTVLQVKEESVVIYVGSDKTKMEFKKWAIGQAETKKEAAKSAKTEEAASSAPKFKKLKKKEKAPAEEKAE